MSDGRGPGAGPISDAAETARLADRIAAVRDAASPVSPETLEAAVRQVVESMAGDLGLRETGLLAEVEALGRTIDAARAEIAAIRPDDITGSHIPSATDELDAIVAHTAGATHAILEACETLDQVAGGLDGEAADALQAATTQIYEACGFQDITGQRITKVVAALKAIDAKVTQIIAAFGPRDGDGAAVPPAAAPSLENGPQLPQAAMDQSDIDALLASFE